MDLQRLLCHIQCRQPQAVARKVAFGVDTVLYFVCALDINPILTEKNKYLLQS